MPTKATWQKLQVFKIQDGGRPPFWKLLNRHISVQNCPTTADIGPDYSHVTNEIFNIEDGDGLHVENRFLGRNSLNGRRISAKFCNRKQNADKGHLTKTANFQNSRWRTAAILKIVESPYLSENIIPFWQHLVILVYYRRYWTWWDFEKHYRSILDVIR